VGRGRVYKTRSRHGGAVHLSPQQLVPVGERPHHSPRPPIMAVHSPEHLPPHLTHPHALPPAADPGSHLASRLESGVPVELGVVLPLVQHPPLPCLYFTHRPMAFLANSQTGSPGLNNY